MSYGIEREKHVAKLTKGFLKQLIKECIAEVLAEGLGSTLAEAVQRQSTSASELSAVKKQQFVPSKKQVNSTLSEAVKKAAGGDPTFADILADTAATSLQNVLANDTMFRTGEEGISSHYNHGVGHTIEEQIVAKHSPTEIFGEEAAQNWQKLAFLDAPGRNHS